MFIVVNLKPNNNVYGPGLIVTADGEVKTIVLQPQRPPQTWTETKLYQDLKNIWSIYTCQFSTQKDQRISEVRTVPSYLNILTLKSWVVK